MSHSQTGQQLALNVRPRLAYSSENFVVHSGVRTIIQCTLEHLGQDRGHCLFVYGEERSGKTHLALRLAEEVARCGSFPRLFEPDEFVTALESLSVTAVHSDDVFIVDDAHVYLQQIQPGDSGPFVRFIEALRAQHASVVLCSAKQIEDIPCDDHVKSRLRSGTGLAIGSPLPEEMAALLKGLARQRGIALRKQHIDYLEKRVQRSLPWLVDYFERLAHLSHSLAKGLSAQDLQSIL
jgi:chromosomal replication initiation ATPase DnaA